MYKIFPSALSVMSDREWREATVSGQCSQVEGKKKGANRISQKSEKKC